MAACLLRIRGAGDRALQSYKAVYHWPSTATKLLKPNTSVSHRKDFQRYSTTDVLVPSSARAVVCGGGVIGTSVAYHLADRGWTDVVLLEQGRLACGTTWHSAGLIGQVRETMSYTQLMKYSRQLYIELDRKRGVGWKQCGSLSLAQTNDRLLQLTRNHAIAKASGVESHIVAPSEIRDICSSVRTDDVVGGLWIPGDGALTAPDLVSALATEAKDKGVKILEGVKVNKINTKNGEVSALETSHGLVQCQVFINCAGQWARELGFKSDPPVNVPLQPMEHFYMVTSPVQGMDRMMPVIRDYDGGVYSREWSGGLLSGGFEDEGKPAFLEGIPDNFEFQLLPEDWAHFQNLLDPIIKRFPLMETAQIRQQLNGPESFTPDGNWNVGEVPNIKNYYVAAGMTAFGVAGAGAVGRHLSELIIDGHTTLDIPGIDIKRYSEYYNGQTFLRERSKEVIGKYRMFYPGQQWTSGRNLEVSPLHSKMLDAGACFGQDCTFEKPLWFNTRAEQPFNQYTSQNGTFGKPSWFNDVREEYRACKETVGLIDASSFSQIEIWSREDEAYSFLQYLCSSEVANDVSKASATGMQNLQGGYECHCLVVPQSRNRYVLCVPSSEKTRLLHWVRKHLPDSVQLRDTSSSHCRILLLGPNAKQLLNEICSTTVDQTSYSRKVTDVGVNSGVQIVTQSWCGEDGFLLLIPSQCSLQVYDKLMAVGQEHGIKNVGHLALKQLQVENFYPQWIQELGRNVTPLDAGLSDYIGWNKNFIGRDILLQKRQTEIPQQIVQLAIENFLPNKIMWVWGGEPVYLGDVCVGSVSSSGYSFNSNTMYCLGKIDAQKTSATSIVNKDATFDILVSGEIYRAKVTTACPKM